MCVNLCTVLSNVTLFFVSAFNVTPTSCVVFFSAAKKYPKPRGCVTNAFFDLLSGENEPRGPFKLAHTFGFD